MKRILFLRSNPISPDVRVEKEMESLVSAGYQVSAVGWERSRNGKADYEDRMIQDHPVRIHRLHYRSEFGGGFRKNLVPLFQFECGLLGWLVTHRSEYDLIHACDFDTALIARIACWITKKQFVYDIFDYYVDCYHVPHCLRKYVERIDQSVIQSAYKVILCSENRVNQVKLYDKERYVIIHNAPKLEEVDPKAIELKQGSQENRCKIVYVGGFTTDRFLKELADSVASETAAELHIAGYGRLQTYFEELQEKTNNIFFYGKINYEKTLALEAQCDYIAAFYNPNKPNNVYAAPNKFYEALMLGKPILMVQGSGCSDIVAEKRWGLVVAPSEQGIKEIVKRTITTDKREFDVREAKRMFEQNYQWSIMGQRLIDLYNHIDNLIGRGGVISRYYIASHIITIHAVLFCSLEWRARRV